MAYEAGFRDARVEIYNRSSAVDSEFGLDGSGIGWQKDDEVYASVTWAKGNMALNAGSLDVYAVVNVRMNYTDKVTRRSHIVYDGETYQILGDTFHADYRKNEIEFKAQLVINEDDNEQTQK